MNSLYQTEAKDLIIWHLKIHTGHITRLPATLLKYIIKSIDAYDKEYLEEYDRETLISEVKNQLQIK